MNISTQGMMLEKLIKMNWRYCNVDLKDKTNEEIENIAKDIYVEITDEASFADTPTVWQFVKELYE